MMELSVKLFESAPKVPLGELIHECDTRNSQLVVQLNETSVVGISTDKKFIETKANLMGVSLSSYKVVKPNQFAYVPDTSRRGDKIALAFNGGNNSVLISSIYTTFETHEDRLLPEYLYLLLSRPEFDRLARYNSWGSARETFVFADLSLVEIPLPSIEVQREYVAAYKALQQLAEQNEALAEPLQKACSSFLSDLKSKYTSQLLGEYIEYYDERNGNKFGLDNLRGVSIDKVFIPTKASMDGVSLKSYKIVRPNCFCYVPVTSRNGDKITIALNNSTENYICSSAYEVFKVKSEEPMLAAFLFLYFNRSEFDRLARYNSWGSARETFAFSDLMRVKIPVPPIDIQHSIVALYHCAEEARAIAREAREQLKKLAPAMVQRAANTPVEV